MHGPMKPGCPISRSGSPVGSAASAALTCGRTSTGTESRTAAWAIADRIGLLAEKAQSIRSVVVVVVVVVVVAIARPGDSTPPCQDSNSAATTSNPRPRTGRISPSLETTAGAGESLTGEPLRHPLPAKQRSSPTLPRWVGACASSDPYLKGSKLLSVRKICSYSRPRVKRMRVARPILVNARYTSP